MCAAINNFKEKLNGLMSTLQDSSTKQEAAQSLISSKLGVLPQQTDNTGHIAAAQCFAKPSGEESGYSLQDIKKKILHNTSSTISCRTTHDLDPGSTTAVQVAKKRLFALKFGEYRLEESIFSAKPIQEHFQFENLPVLGSKVSGSFSSAEPQLACQVPHYSSSESYLLCDNKTPYSFRRHDIQYCRAKYPQSCPVLLSQQKEIISRSQTSSPPQKVCLSFQETQVSSQKEGPPLKKICLLPHNRAGRKQSELPVFQQNEVPQKSASTKPRSSFQVVSTRREVDKLSPLSFTQAGLSSEEIYIPSGESPASSGKNRLDQEKNDMAEPTEIRIPHEKNMHKEQIDDHTHQQTPVSLVPIFSTGRETIFTHDQTTKISQEINESFSKDKYLQQQDEVSLRTNETLQSSIFHQPQSSENGNATCPDQSHQDGRVPEEETISQGQVLLSQTEEYSTSSTKRISQSKDGSLMSKKIVFSQASTVDNAKQLSYMHRSQDVQHQRDSPLQTNDLDDACLIVDECSVSSVDVVNISNAPPWEQDKLSMTQDLREATENLEKSLSRLKKQQELHFQQQQLRFGEHYVFSSEHSSELELLNKKLLLESHDDSAPLDANRSHTIFHPCYSQRSSNVLDQNLLILEFNQNTRCDAFSFNDATAAPSIDLPNDFSEVLDYSLPARSDKLLDMHLAKDLTATQDSPSKPLNSENSGKVISSFTEAFSDATPAGAVLMRGEDAAQPTDLSVSTELRKRRSEFNDDLAQTVSDKTLNAVGCYSKMETYSLSSDNREFAGFAQHTESMEESLNFLANNTPTPKCSDRKKVSEVRSRKLSSIKYITKNMRSDYSVRSGSHRKSVKRKTMQLLSVEQSTKECRTLSSDDEEELDCLHGSVAESCGAAVDVVYDMSLSNVDLFEKSKKEVVQIHNCSSWNSSFMSDASSNPVHIYHLDEPTFSAAGVVDNEDLTTQTIVDSTANRSVSLWDSAETYPEDLTISSGDALNLSPRVLPSQPLQSRAFTGSSSGHPSLMQPSEPPSLDGSGPLLMRSNIAPLSSPAVALYSAESSTFYLGRTSQVNNNSLGKKTSVDAPDLRVTCDASGKSALRDDNSADSGGTLSSASNASQSSLLCEASCNLSSRLPHADSKTSNPELSFSEDSKLTVKVLKLNNDSSKDSESYCKSLKPATRKRVNNQAKPGIRSGKKRVLKSNKNSSKLKKPTGNAIGQDIVGSTERQLERKNGRYHCSYCGLQFLHKVSFVKHIRGHSANSCSQCPSNFSSRKALRHHSRLVHSLSIAVTSYSCDTCSRTFTKRPLLYAHQAKHHTSPGQHRCGKCGSLLPSLVALSQHLKQHSSAELPCSLCDATFSRRQQLLHHQQGHERNKCPLCEASCSSRKQLLQHTKIAHPPCALCTGKSVFTHHRCNALVGTGSKELWRSGARGRQTCINNNNINSNKNCDVRQCDEDATARGDSAEILLTELSKDESIGVLGNDICETERSNVHSLQPSSNSLTRNFLSDSQLVTHKLPSSVNDDLHSDQTAKQTCNSSTKLASSSVYNKLMESEIPSLHSPTDVFLQVSSQGILKENHQQLVEVCTISSVADDQQPLEEPTTVVSPSLPITDYASNETTSTNCRLANSRPPISPYSTFGTAASEDCAPTPSVPKCHGRGNPPAPCRSECYVCLPPSLRAPVHACSRCPRVFPRPCLLRDHQAFHDGVGAVRCVCCDKTFASRRGYRKHLASRQHVVAAAREEATAAGGKHGAASGEGEENVSATTVADESVGVEGTNVDTVDGNIRDEVHSTATKEGVSAGCDNSFVNSDRLSEADLAMCEQGCRKGADEMDSVKKDCLSSNKKSELNTSSKNTKSVERRRRASRKWMTADPVVAKSSAGIFVENIKVTGNIKSRASLIERKSSSSTERVADVADKNVIHSVSRGKIVNFKPAKPRRTNTRFTRRLRDSASEENCNDRRVKTAALSSVSKMKTSSVGRGKKRKTSSNDGVGKCALETGLNLFNDCAVQLVSNDRLGRKDGVSVTTSNVSLQDGLYTTKRQHFLGKGREKIVIDEIFESISSCVVQSSNCAKPVTLTEIRYGKSSTMLGGGSSSTSPLSAVVSSTQESCDHGTAGRAAFDEYERHISSKSGTDSSDCERGATAAQERSSASGSPVSTTARAVAIIGSPTRTNLDAIFHDIVPRSSGADDTVAYKQPSKTSGNTLDGAAKISIPVSSTPHSPVKISQPCLVNRSNVYHAGAGCNVTNVNNLCYSSADTYVTSVNCKGNVCSVGHETQLSKPFPLGDTYTNFINYSRSESSPGVQLVSSSGDQYPSEGVCRIITSTIDGTGTLRHAVLRTSSSATCVTPTSLVISVVSSAPLPVNEGPPSCSWSSTRPPVNGDLPSCTLSLSTSPLVSGPQSSPMSSSTPPVNAALPSCPPSSANALPTEPLPPAPSLPKLQCSYCDYSTQRKYSLERHMDTHFNRRRFVCEACGKAFQSLVNLKEHHVFLHSSVRNFQCDKCSLTFKNKSTLVRHVRQRHGNNKPHACHCGISFKRVTHLKRHMLVVHNETTKLQKHAKEFFATDSI